jgi:hypothetical protein
MRRQTVAAVAVGFALATVIGMAVGERSPSAPSPEATLVAETTLPPPPQAIFVTEQETVVGPVVIVAQEPRLDGSQLVINFEVKQLAPIADAANVIEYAGFGSTQVVEPIDLDTVFIDDWSISTPSGDIQGTVANPAARAARFEVGADFDISTVTGLRISSYALRAPVDASVSLQPGAETAPVSPGVTAHLLAITEQDNAIVQVELTSERDFNLDAIAITGEGPGWVSGVREAEGRPRWNLTYDAPQAPSPITLRVVGSVWITLSERIPVSMVVTE